MRGHFSRTVVFVSTVFFFFIFLIPLVFIFSKVSVKSLMDVFTDRYYIGRMGFTLIQAFLSACFSIVIGLPLGWILSKLDFRGKVAVKTIYLIPFMLPSVLVVLGFVIFFGNNGVLAKLLNREVNILYSFKAVLLAHIFYNFPVAAYLISDALNGTDSSEEDDARTCGAGEFAIFFKVTLRRILPSVLSAFCVIFLLCFTSFAIIMVLGGGPFLSTVEVEVYQLAVTSLDFEKACSLSLFSVFVSCSVLLLHRHYEKKNNFKENNSVNCDRVKLSRAKYIVCMMFVFISVIFILCPVFSIFFRALFASSTRGGKLNFSFASFSSISFKPLFNTLFISLLSAVLSVFIAYGFCLSEKKILPMLPMAVSSVITGLSYFLLSRFFTGLPPIIAIVLADGVLNIPFAFKSLSARYNGIPETFKDWAELCRCPSFFYFRKVEFPLLRAPMFTAFLLCFASSMGELNAALILGASKVETVSVAIMHMVSSYNYQGACAQGCVLMLVCIPVFFLARKV